MLRRLRTRARDERGVALVMALIVMAALAAGLTTVIISTSSSGRTATRASADQVAYAAAEAGINLAMSALHATDTNALNSSALPTTTTDFPVGCSGNGCTGKVTWGGTLDTTFQTWHITSTGSARNQAGPNLPDRTRTLTATSYVQPDLAQQVNNQVWNYIYAYGKRGDGLCDVDIFGGSKKTTVAAPLYVEGNLCLANNAILDGTASGTNHVPVGVVVKGATTFGNSTSGVGTDYWVDEAHMNTCGSSFASLHSCTAKSQGGSDAIWATQFDHSPTAVTPVTVQWSYYYANAAPGPSHPCSGSNSNNPTMDSDTTQDLTTNGNAPSNPTTTAANTFWLTPDTYDYSCISYAADGTKLGEISWDHTARHLTVWGAMYYDGNLLATGTSYYTGQATLYATGWLNLNGRLCGNVVVNGDCVYTPGGTNQWNPNTTMLIVVVHGNDGSGNSVAFTNSNGAHWQGGLYATNNLVFANNAVVEGPIIAGYIGFNNNVTAKPFPVINSVPTGAPGNPNVFADALPPTVSG